MRGESPPRAVIGETDRQPPGRARTLDIVDSDDPVAAVLDALETLSDDETLEIISRVSPVPLYDRLDDRGWRYDAVRAGPDRWRIRITAEDGAAYCGERLRRPRWNRPR